MEETDHKSYSFMLMMNNGAFFSIRICFFLLLQEVKSFGFSTVFCLLLLIIFFLFISGHRSTIPYRMKVHFVRTNLLWFDSCGTLSIASVVMYIMGKNRVHNHWKSAFECARNEWNGVYQKQIYNTGLH